MNIINTYSDLPEIFFHRNLPKIPSRPTLIGYNHDLAKDLGINFSEGEILQIFSGTKLPASFQSISMNYCGHQFGHFNPQLGDGRAHLIAEVLAKTKDKTIYDIQLKGSGQSQFSRSGDGLSPIGPVIREYILSEAMHTLGVPTTRALCAIETGDKVYRDKTYPGGVFTRVSPSLIRVGNFEYFASRDDYVNLKILADYTINRLYPNLKNDNEKYLNFFKAVAKKNIELVSKWMSFGFIHGVMNTDNTSVFGLTIDYGPCAFIDDYQSEKVFSSIDRNGRYSFKNQRQICLWNLSIFARSLFPLLQKEVKGSDSALIEVLEKEFDEFESFSTKSYFNEFAKKFGFSKPPAGFDKYLNDFLNFMEENGLDFTNTFFDLRKIEFPNEELKNQWIVLLARQGIEKSMAITIMEKSNPYIIPRNHLVDRAIKEGEGGDFNFFNLLNMALKNPFNVNEQYSTLHIPPTEKEVISHTFCGT